MSKLIKSRLRKESMIRNNSELIKSRLRKKSMIRNEIKVIKSILRKESMIHNDNHDNLILCLSCLLSAIAVYILL